MTSVEVTLTGAEVLLPDGPARCDLFLSGGQVVDAPAGRRVDLSGYLVLPGIVDLHGDGFERHMAPRRGAMKEMTEGVVAAEAELAANGITTAVLAQFWSWEGGLRGPDFAAGVFQAIRQVRDGLVTDLIPQLRFETHLLADYPTLTERLVEWQVPYVVFNDHLPHERLAEGRKPPRLAGQALKAGRSPEAHLELLKALHANGPQVPKALDELCADLHRRGSAWAVMTTTAPPIAPPGSDAG